MKSSHRLSSPRVFLASIGLSTGLIITFILFILLNSISVNAGEQIQGDISKPEMIDNIAEVGQGTLLFKHGNQYSKAAQLNIDVAMLVTGMINRVSVTQSFSNTTDHWQEGIYVFPLPENAAVDQLRLKIGDRIIEGQIKEKLDAKKIYQQAKKQGKQAALTEQERPNIFTTSVANIAPHETIKVEIEYQQIVNYDNGIFSLRFPMVVGTRYIPGKPNIDKQYVEGFSGTGWALTRTSPLSSTADADLFIVTERTPSRRLDVVSTTPSPSSSPCVLLQQHLNTLATNRREKCGFNTDEVPDAARITPPVLQAGSERKNKVTIKINLDAGLALEKIDSPYHEIEVNKHSDQYQIILKQESTLANRDFELTWQPHPSVAPKAALFTEKINGDTYAMIMMLPPSVENSETLNREIIYVIDTSGSMGGQSIIQARAALEFALTRLKPEDRFNIIQFNSQTSKLFNQSEWVTPASLQQAINYVRSLNAGGGTEMAIALRAALANQDKNNDLRQVIFLTDGSIGNEQALFEIIQQKLGRSRLFTIGIGSAPNSHFMQRAANFGRGTHTYIGKLDEVQTRMRTLFEKIESPVLKDISIDWTQTNMEIWPKKIIDLYQGEPLLITAKTNQLPGEINITGKVANNNWSSSLKLNGGQNQKGISTLWARSKIAALMQQKRGAEFVSIKQTIIDTALEHHLVSKYTSLVAVDVTPVRPKDQELDSHAIPTHLPKGWDHNKVFGQQFPATATDARMNFIIGLILMLLTSFIYLTRRHHSYV